MQASDAAPARSRAARRRRWAAPTRPPRDRAARRRVGPRRGDDDRPLAAADALGCWTAGSAGLLCRSPAGTSATTARPPTRILARSRARVLSLPPRDDGKRLVCARIRARAAPPRRRASAHGWPSCLSTAGAARDFFPALIPANQALQARCRQHSDARLSFGRRSTRATTQHSALRCSANRARGQQCTMI